MISVIFGCAANAQRSAALDAMTSYYYNQYRQSAPSGYAPPISISGQGVNVIKLKSGTADMGRQGKIISAAAKNNLIDVDSVVQQYVARYKEMGEKGFGEHMKTQTKEKQTELRQVFFRAQPRLHAHLYREICDVMKEQGIPTDYFNGFNRQFRPEEGPDLVLLAEGDLVEKVLAYYKGAKPGQEVEVDVQEPDRQHAKIVKVGTKKVKAPLVTTVHEFCGLEGEIADDPAGGRKQAEYIVKQIQKIGPTLAKRLAEYARQHQEAEHAIEKTGEDSGETLDSMLEDSGETAESSE